MTRPLYVPLIPADPRRCQAEVYKLMKPLQFGGGPYGASTRCSNAPVAIAAEAQPGSDGIRGRMSLCAACRAQLLAEFGGENYVFTEL